MALLRLGYGRNSIFHDELFMKPTLWIKTAACEGLQGLLHDLRGLSGKS